MATQTIITRKGDDVVTNIVTTAQTVENGLQVTDTMGTYVIANINDYNVYQNIETAATIVPQQYKYTTSGGFVSNTSYVAPIDTAKQIEELQKGLLQAQAAINTLLGV